MCATGTAQPSCIKWTFSETLNPLSPSSAKLFLSINSSTFDGLYASQRLLDQLLQALDYVPLAIHLLVHVSVGLLPHQVLGRWQEERSSMLCINGTTSDKLESADVSISLSIVYLNIERNPEAIQLLGMLSLLPDGLLRWHERPKLIVQSFGLVFSVMDILRKHALVYTAGDKLGVLSPIRHFVLCHHPADAQYVHSMYSVFWDFVETHTTNDLGPGFRALQPDMGNIGNLVQHAASMHPSPKVFQMAITMSWHLLRTTPSTHFLEKIYAMLSTASLEMRRNPEFAALIQRSQ